MKTTNSPLFVDFVVLTWPFSWHGSCKNAIDWCRTVVLIFFVNIGDKQKWKLQYLLASCTTQAWHGMQACMAAAKVP